MYADQNKVAGVDIRDPQEASKIYNRYLEAFKTGVYSYIKEEHDPLTREVIPRKYFSGGVVGDMSMMNVIPVPVDFAEKPGNKLKLTVDMVASFSSKDLGADEFIDPRDFVVVRNRLLSENCAGYAIEMKKIVNPNDQPIVGIYGGSGADVSSFFLSTNATQGFFVDTTAVHRESLEDESLKNSVLEVEYKTRKFESGYALSYASTGMTSIEFKVITELKAIGVTRNDIIILPKEFWERRFPDEHNKPVTIKFAWAYPGQEKKERTITFIDADITAPLQFPGILKEVLQEGIDFYYQRAGYWIASRYEKFIPFLLKGMKAGAFLLTDDHYIIHYSVQEADDLEDVLRSQDVAFRMPSELESEGMKYFARRIIEGKQIEEDRYDRYGWRVRIRQLLGGANQSRVEAGSGIDVTGGIDLTPADRAMQIQNSGGAVKFRLDPARLEQLRHAPGFSPVILNVQPMTDLKLFLGLKQAG